MLVCDRTPSQLMQCPSRFIYFSSREAISPSHVLFYFIFCILFLLAIHIHGWAKSLQISPPSHRGYIYWGPPMSGCPTPHTGDFQLQCKVMFIIYVNHFTWIRWHIMDCEWTQHVVLGGKKVDEDQLTVLIDWKASPSPIAMKIQTFNLGI